MEFLDRLQLVKDVIHKVDLILHPEHQIKSSATDRLLEGFKHFKEL